MCGEIVRVRCIELLNFLYFLAFSLVLRLRWLIKSQIPFEILKGAGIREIKMCLGEGRPFVVCTFAY